MTVKHLSLSKQLKLFNKEILNKHHALKKQGIDVFQIGEEALLNRIADLLMNAVNEPDWMVTLALYSFASKNSEFAPAQLIAENLKDSEIDGEALDLPKEDQLVH